MSSGAPSDTLMPLVSTTAMDSLLVAVALTIWSRSCELKETMYCIRPRSPSSSQGSPALGASAAEASLTNTTPSEAAAFLAWTS